MTTQATNAKGETIQFSDVRTSVLSFEPTGYPDGFAEWLDDSDHRTGGLMEWLANGDFDTAIDAESVATEWIDNVLIDAFWLIKN